ncbi:MAG: NAD(+)/NADH kinase [Bacteroidota bacterium]
MIYGITGNTTKAKLWKPAARLMEWMTEHEIPFRLAPDVGLGLVKRELMAPETVRELACDDLPDVCDVLVSFGGDGTMLGTAASVGDRGVPILGVNIGRLGFLADIEIAQIESAIRQLEAGRYRVEDRTVLLGDAGDGVHRFALNEFVLKREASGTMISIRVEVDGRYLNTYWCDGLIVATSTGSTAYSLSAGGPIIEPGSGVILITPLAPHTLTVRPILVPNTAIVEAVVDAHGESYTLSYDGKSFVFPDTHSTIRIQRAQHTVKLIKLPDQDYFDTLREKLGWGR